MSTKTIPIDSLPTKKPAEKNTAEAAIDTAAQSKAEDTQPKADDTDPAKTVDPQQQTAQDPKTGQQEGEQTLPSSGLNTYQDITTSTDAAPLSGVAALELAPITGLGFTADASVNAKVTKLRGALSPELGDDSYYTTLETPANTWRNSVSDSKITPPPPTLGITADLPLVNENAVDPQLAYTLTLSSAATTDITVTIKVDGATLDANYAATAVDQGHTLLPIDPATGECNITIPAGSTQWTFSIPVLDASIAENAQVTVTIQGSANGQYTLDSAHTSAELVIYDGPQAMPMTVDADLAAMHPLSDDSTPQGHEASAGPFASMAATGYAFLAHAENELFVPESVANVFTPLTMTDSLVDAAQFLYAENTWTNGDTPHSTETVLMEVAPPMDTESSQTAMLIHTILVNSGV